MYARARDGGEKIRGTDGGAEELPDGREWGRGASRGVSGVQGRTGGLSREGRDCKFFALVVVGFIWSHAFLIAALLVSGEAEVSLVGRDMALEESACDMSWSPYPESELPRGR